MKIGVLDLLTDAPPQGWAGRLYGLYFRKQFMSVTPQYVAAWCRQLGHEVVYATYYGQRPPHELMPSDCDAVFIGAYTQASALAYALAILFKRQGALTVLGGPHARAFPSDALRFFDIAVIDCDKPLIERILKGDFGPGSVASSGRPLADMPSIAERMPDIRIASFHKGRPLLTSVVPTVSSVGCPYTCDFCIDWNRDYVALPETRLAEDLAFLSQHYPKVLLAFHDPNFAVRFDQTMDVIARQPEGRRNPYIMESSLSILKPARLQRLKETNCVYVAPGVESWEDYSNKAGTAGKHGAAKVDQVVSHLRQVAEAVPGLQANILFGGDHDAGTAPVDLTIDFINRTPEVWPTINIPSPFGGTPLYDGLYRSGRILATLPFAFYYNPYLAIIPKNYTPLEYYGHLIRMHEAITSNAMLWRRLTTGKSRTVRFVHALRTLETRRELGNFRALHRQLESDAQFRAFHEGRTPELPDYYHQLFAVRLGAYAELLPPAARTPVLEPPASPAPRSRAAAE